jgi:hypothetical protein
MHMPTRLECAWQTPLDNLRCWVSGGDWQPAVAREPQPERLGGTSLQVTPGVATMATKPKAAATKAPAAAAAPAPAPAAKKAVAKAPAAKAAMGTTVDSAPAKGAAAAAKVAGGKTPAAAAAKAPAKKEPEPEPEPSPALPKTFRMNRNSMLKAYLVKHGWTEAAKDARAVFGACVATCLLHCAFRCRFLTAPPARA